MSLMEQLCRVFLLQSEVSSLLTGLWGEGNCSQVRRLKKGSGHHLWFPQLDAPPPSPAVPLPPHLSICPLLLPSPPSSATLRTWVSSPLAHPEVTEPLPLNPPSRFKMMSDPEEPPQPQGKPYFLVKKTQLVSFLQGSKANLTFVTLHYVLAVGSDFNCSLLLG